MAKKNRNPIRRVVSSKYDVVKGWWILSLHCGHEEVVKSDERPLRMYMKCVLCGGGEQPMVNMRRIK